MSTSKLRPASTFREFSSSRSPTQKLRGFVRDASVFGLSLTARVPQTKNWIRFPYYHHVFDDERKPFEAQLRYMRKFGEIISLDDAVEMLASSDPLDGRYFCITFDDGFKNCITNIAPILVEHQAPAAFFVPTRYIGSSLERDTELLLGFYKHGSILMEFLDWDDCRQLAAAGMTVGSHTVSHRVLSELTDVEVERELRESKETIERELGTECEHFCAPVGRPDLDFRTNRDPELARKCGYRSFLTTRRGSVDRIGSPMAVDRDHTLAIWGVNQLRYFFSQ